METAVLIPIKAFRSAKGRLSDWLPERDRTRLARWMAGQVLLASRPFPTFVACDDDEVAEWATDLGAEVLWSPGLGLNGAVDHGADVVAGKGADHVIITHSDLPLPEGLTDVADHRRVVLVPDGHRDGTNVLARPCDIHVPASYGQGSFRRHLGLALASESRVTVRLDEHLSIDIDTIDDCRHPSVVPILESVLGEATPR